MGASRVSGGEKVCCILVIMLKDSGWWDFIAEVKTSTNSDINTGTSQLLLSSLTLGCDKVRSAPTLHYTILYYTILYYTILYKSIEN